jgi:methylmalonyl-CoA/ethylmalonyl-CoA epimerase
VGDPPAGPFGGLHHIGIVAWDVREAEKRIRSLLGGRVVASGDDDVIAVSWTWIEAPCCPVLELLMPTGDDGPIARDLRERGPGLHHLSFQPVTVDAAQSHVRECALPTIGDGHVHDDYEQIFVDPKATAGALFHAFRAVHGRK